MEPRLLITPNEHRSVQLNPAVGGKGMRDDPNHELGPDPTGAASGMNGKGPNQAAVVRSGDQGNGVRGCSYRAYGRVIVPACARADERAAARHAQRPRKIQVSAIANTPAVRGQTRATSIANRSAV